MKAKPHIQPDVVWITPTRRFARVHVARPRSFVPHCGDSEFKGAWTSCVGADAIEEHMDNLPGGKRQLCGTCEASLSKATVEAVREFFVPRR